MIGCMGDMSRSEGSQLDPGDCHRIRSCLQEALANMAVSSSTESHDFATV